MATLNLTTKGARLLTFIKDCWSILLVWSCLVLLPFGRLVEVPVTIMTIASIVLIVRHGKSYITSTPTRLFTVAFLCAWVPIVLSVPDAISPANSTRVAFGSIRFYLAGIFITYALTTSKELILFLRLSSAVLAFWIVDGYVQLSTGTDLFGYTSDFDRINALFGDRNPKFGILLAILSPVLIEYVRRQRSPALLTFTAVATAVLVLLVGTRSAWITLGVILAAYLLLLWMRNQRIPWRGLVITGLLTTLVVSVLYVSSERFSDRLDNAVAGLTGKAGLTGSSIGHRYTIWKGAVKMIAANPINGVGARGFRHSFAEHAAPDDPFFYAEPPIIPMHPHQVILDLLAETGLIGLIGTVAMIVVLVRAARRADPAGIRYGLPYGLCLIAAYFPFNTHLAIYSSLWAQVLWWITALYCAGISIKAADPDNLNPS